MASDLLTADLSLIPAGAIAKLPLRSIGIDDPSSLARLYLVSHPSGIGADDLGARSEILAAFAGEYGFLRSDASLLSEIDGQPVGAVMTVNPSGTADSTALSSPTCSLVRRTVALA